MTIYKTVEFIDENDTIRIRTESEAVICLRISDIQDRVMSFRTNAAGARLLARTLNEFADELDPPKDEFLTPEEAKQFKERLKAQLEEMVQNRERLSERLQEMMSPAKDESPVPPASGEE